MYRTPNEIEDKNALWSFSDTVGYLFVPLVLAALVGATVCLVATEGDLSALVEAATTLMGG